VWSTPGTRSARPRPGRRAAPGREPDDEDTPARAWSYDRPMKKLIMLIVLVALIVVAAKKLRDV
jgi:hypothetical protein